MADAVEKASVVLICISHKYKESPNCRTGELCLPLISMWGQVSDDFDQMVSRWLPVIEGFQVQSNWYVDHHDNPMPLHRRWRHHKPCFLNTNVASITRVERYLRMLSWVLKTLCTATNAVFVNCLLVTLEWLVSPSGSHSPIRAGLTSHSRVTRRQLPNTLLVGLQLTVTSS